MSVTVADAFDALLLDLDAKARNAAVRNKPTMWAYYLDVAAGLRDELWEADRTNESYVLHLLSLAYRAQTVVPNLADANDAARLWARGVYARRVLRTAGVPVPHPTLDWLHQRAETAA